MATLEVRDVTPSVAVRGPTEKLFAVARTVFLHFAHSAGAAAHGRRAFQVHAVSLICSARRGSTEADMLHTVFLRVRAAAAAAVSKGSSPFVTENMMAPHAVDEVLDDYRQSSG